MAAAGLSMEQLQPAWKTLELPRMYWPALGLLVLSASLVCSLLLQRLRRRKRVVLLLPLWGCAAHLKVVAFVVRTVHIRISIVAGKQKGPPPERQWAADRSTSRISTTSSRTTRVARPVQPTAVVAAAA